MSDGNDRCTQCDCMRAEHGECPKCSGHVFVEPPVRLPHVEFEIVGFIHLVWILVELQHTQAKIEATYLRANGRWL